MATAVQQRNKAEAPLGVPHLHWYLTIALILFRMVYFVAHPKYREIQNERRISPVWHVIEGEHDVSEIGTTLTSERTFTWPGGYQEAGFSAKTAWFYQTVDFQDINENETYALTFCDLRSGLPTLFVNHKFADKGPYEMGGMRVEEDVGYYFHIAPGLLRTGANLLILKVEFGLLGEDVVMEPTIRFAKHSELWPWYERVSTYHRIFINGSIATTIALALVNLALWSYQRKTARGTLYRDTFLALCGFVMVAILYTRIGFGGAIQSPLIIARWIAIFIGLCAGVRAVSAWYTGNKMPLWMRVSMWFNVALVPLCVALAYTPLYTCLPYFYIISAVTYGGPSMAVAAWEFVILGIRKRHGYEIVLASAFAFSALVLLEAVTTDILALSDFFLTGVVTTAVTHFALAFGAVSLAQFVDFERMNQALVSQLKSTETRLELALTEAEDVLALKSSVVGAVTQQFLAPLENISTSTAILRTYVTMQRRARCSNCHSEFELDPGDQIDATTECPECAKASHLSASSAQRFSGPGDMAYALLHRLRTAGEQLLTLVNGVLDAAKTSSENVTLDRQHVDLKLASEGMFEELSRRLSSQCRVEPHITASGVGLLTVDAWLTVIEFLAEACCGLDAHRQLVEVEFVATPKVSKAKFSNIATEIADVLQSVPTERDPLEGTRLKLTLARGVLKRMDAEISYEGKDLTITVGHHEAVSQTLESRDAA